MRLNANILTKKFKLKIKINKNLNYQWAKNNIDFCGQQKKRKQVSNFISEKKIIIVYKSLIES